MEAPQKVEILDPRVTQAIENFKFNEALDYIWSKIAQADKQITDAKPWELSAEKSKPILLDIIGQIQYIGYNLQPFMPDTADKILKQFSGKVKSSAPLFPRI